MNIASGRVVRGDWLPRLALILLMAVWAPIGWAQQDPPGRVGRLADAQGEVSWWDHESGRWIIAGRNQPLTTGDRVATSADGRAELRIGSTVLRLADRSEIEVLRLDDERMSFQLHSGSLALRVKSREVAEEIFLVTDEAHFSPLRAGHYRLDRIDDTTQAGAWRGELRIDDPAGFTINPGQSVEIIRDGRARTLRTRMLAPANDRFAEWVVRDDQREQGSASARFVSPEMTGIEDLDRAGRWEPHPEYGSVWIPFEVRAGWAPYSDGRWAWVRPWGWTWVDNSAWGFAPFHYGRWARWRGGWCWVPGALVARPVFSPGLVAWVDGGGAGFQLQIGGPRMGWLPLGPREVYVPPYRVTPGYHERVNPMVPPRPNQGPVQAFGGPGHRFEHQGAPGAVTVTQRELPLIQAPVVRGPFERREWTREGPRESPRDGARVGPRDGPREFPRDGRREDRPREAQPPHAAVTTPPAATVVVPAAQPAASAEAVAPRPRRGWSGESQLRGASPAAPTPQPMAVPGPAQAKPPIERPRDAERERGREPERRQPGVEGQQALREREHQR